MKRKILSAFLALVIAVSSFGVVSSFSALGAAEEINYQCGENITWSLDTSLCLLEISGSGEMYNYSLVDNEAPWISYKKYIKKVIVSEGITSIGNYAFDNCNQMAEISLPSTLKSIGTGSFQACDSLTEVKLPEGLKSIGASAFWCCRNLKRLEIPSSLTAFSFSSINQTDSLDEIVFPNGCNFMHVSANAIGIKCLDDITEGPVYFGNLLYEYRGEMVENTVFTVKDGTRLIRGSAFKNQTGLTDIIIPDSVWYVGIDALAGTTWYDSQPDGLVMAGKVAYDYKGTMDINEVIALPDGTTGISPRAFKNDDLLVQLDVSSTLKYIGQESLYWTNRLTDISLPDGFKVIDTRAFEGAYIESITLPASIEYIGDLAFSSSYIRSVVFENGFSYDKIPEGMFRTCTRLETVVLSEGIKVIEAQAFKSCSKLTCVTIPKSVEKIADNAFDGSDSVIIYCYADSTAHYYAIEKGINYVLLDDIPEKVATENIVSILKEAEKIVRELYSDESLAELDAAVSAVDLNAENLTQSKVDAWETVIKSAISNLKYKPADYYAVETAQKRAESIDRSLYTAESLEKLDSALDSIEENLDITNQSRVNSIAREINSAIDSLVYLPADYSGVEAAIAESKKIEKRLYSQATLAILEQSVSAVEYGLNITEQPKVNTFADNINFAISALEFADVVLRNEPHGIIVSATAKEIDPDTALTVDLKDSSDLQSGNFAVGGTVKSITLYDINLLLNTQKTQPDGFVAVKIKLPNGVDPKRCKVYHVIDDPVDPLVRYTTSLEGNFIVFETNHFSEFAVIEVETVIDSIEIAKLPNKTAYALGETVNTSGLEVTAHYSDGTSKNVADYDVSSVDTSSIGIKTVTAYYTYNGTTKSASFEINVSGDKVSANITLGGEKIREYNKKVAWYKGYSSESLQLECNLPDSGKYNIKWSSDNSKVLVDENGKVTNKGFFFPRKATITVTVTDSAGNALATDNVVVKFYKFSFQLSNIQSTMSQFFQKSELIF